MKAKHLVSAGRIRRSLVASLCMAACVLPASGAQAEDKYPSRPITLVMPFAPGGITDLTARTFAKYMGDRLGGTIVVMNRPGAGGTIAAQHVARSAPDGYTLLFGTNVTHAISPQLLPEVRYDPLKDLTSVGMFGHNGNVLIVPPSLPVKTFPEFLDYLKAKKGEAIGASPSIGSSSHLAAELLQQKVPGARYLHVPYNGPTASMAAVIGKHVDFMFTNIGAAIAQINAGQVRAIAVTTGKRVPQLPDVATVIESGVPDFDIVGWFVAAAPKGTPPAIIKRLNEVLNAAQDDPTLRKTMEDMTVELQKATPEQTDAFVQAEYKKWGDIIRGANIKLN